MRLFRDGPGIKLPGYPVYISDLRDRPDTGYPAGQLLNYYLFGNQICGQKRRKNVFGIFD